MADAPKFSVEVTGVSDVLRALKSKMRAYPDAAKVALYRAGVRIHGPAVRRAPVEFGVLRASAYVSAPQMENGSPVVEMGFGTQYAAFQHEHEMNHPLGGEDHYLSQTVSDQLGGMLAHMAADIEWAAKDGVKFGAVGGIPTRPKIGAPVGPNAKNRKPHQVANGRSRFKAQARNVSRKTGR